MITPEYCRTMARYNAWQNTGLRKAIEAMPMTDLEKDRGAFFGSIWATVNHLLWADTIWMSRFDGGPAPEGGLKDSTGICATKGDWEARRYRMDGRIREWAHGLDGVDLIGNLTWYSGATGREMSKPFALCVVQLFNHQTHHRGQIHAMLTAAGVRMPDTDLPFMPDEV